MTIMNYTFETVRKSRLFTDEAYVNGWYNSIVNQQKRDVFGLQVISKLTDHTDKELCRRLVQTGGKRLV